MLISAVDALAGAGLDATTAGSVPTVTGASATGWATGSATTGGGRRVCAKRSTAGADCTSDQSTPYATTKPAATRIRAFRSPGSVIGGASCETSQPHCLHSFASGSIGSPQKLQYFLTLWSGPWSMRTSQRLRGEQPGGKREEGRGKREGGRGKREAVRR